MEETTKTWQCNPHDYNGLVLHNCHRFSRCLYTRVLQFLLYSLCLGLQPQLFWLHIQLVARFGSINVQNYGELDFIKPSNTFNILGTFSSLILHFLFGVYTVCYFDTTQKLTTSSKHVVSANDNTR